MDSVALLVTLGLTFTLAVLSSRQLLGGVLYMMARNAGTQPLAVAAQTPASASDARVQS